jgi:predicted transcriptional regulator
MTSRELDVLRRRILDVLTVNQPMTVREVTTALGMEITWGNCVSVGHSLRRLWTAGMIRCSGIGTHATTRKYWMTEKDKALAAKRYERFHDRAGRKMVVEE